MIKVLPDFVLHRIFGDSVLCIHACQTLSIHLKFKTIRKTWFKMAIHQTSSRLRHITYQEQTFPLYKLLKKIENPVYLEQLYLLDPQIFRRVVY